MTLPQQSPYARWAPYVGAAVDLGPIEDKRGKADEAKKQSDKTLGIALGTHAEYGSALAANAYAQGQFDDLRAMTATAYAIAQGDPSSNSAAKAALLWKYHDDARARLTYLGLEREQILADMAAHAYFPKFPGGGGTYLPPGALPAPPGFSPATPNGDGGGGSGGGGGDVPAAESELGHKIGTVFVVIGIAAATLAIALPATAALVYRKVTS